MFGLTMRERDKKFLEQRDIPYNKKSYRNYLELLVANRQDLVSIQRLQQVIEHIEISSQVMMTNDGHLSPVLTLDLRQHLHLMNQAFRCNLELITRPVPVTKYVSSACYEIKNVPL